MLKITFVNKPFTHLFVKYVLTDLETLLTNFMYNY